MIKFEKYRIELNALQNPLACYNRLGYFVRDG